MPIKIGTPVRQIVPVIKGEVKRAVFDDVAEKFKYLVAFGEGESAGERWFDEDQVEIDPEVQEGV